MRRRYVGLVQTTKARQNDKRVAPSATTAEEGLHRVMADLVSLGWGPVDNRQHDLGTDLLVHVRDDRGFDRALLIGAQVKAGNSYFTAPSRQPDVEGWWYAEDDTDHFDIWSNHVLPHLLILHDPSSKLSYWQRVTPDRVVSTGAGAKILVPRSNTLETKHLVSLIDELGRPVVGERNNYSAIAPGDRMRHALLAPFDGPRRATFAPTSSPTEFVATLMRGYTWRLREIWVPPSRRTWAVGFAEAVANWRLTGDAVAFRSLARSARFLRDKCAATILYASGLRASERHVDARAVLSLLLDGDQLAPTDHAWCLIHRARANMELGDLAQARMDAAGVARSVALAKQHDHVGRALAGVAATMLFRLADTHTEPPAFGPGVHDPVARWRESLVSSALSAAAGESFQALSSTRSLRFANVDSVIEDLNAASLNADLLGDHSEWCRIEGLVARLQIQRRHGDESAVANAIDRLRRVGATDAIKVIADHIYHHGPVRPLADAVDMITPARISATSSRATLELARLASAHYMSDEAQKDLALVVLQSLGPTAPTRRPAKLLRQGVTSYDQFKALASLISFSTDQEMHDRSAALVGQRLTSGRPLDLHELERVAGQLDLGSVSPKTYRSLIDVCLSMDGPVCSSVLGLAAAAGDPTVIATLKRRAVTGDLTALDALFEADDAAQLDPPAQRALLRTLATRIQDTISSAERGAFGFGGQDNARAYCVANVRFSSVGPWVPVLNLLGSPHVNPSDKVGAMRILAEFAPDLPSRFRAKLQRLPIPIHSKFTTPLDVSADGALHALRLALGSADGVSLGMKMGFGNEDARVDLARCLGQGRIPELRPMLALLVRDSSRDVTNAAANALGRLAAAAPEPFLDSLLDYTTAHPGVEVPIATLHGVLRTAQPVASPQRRALIDRVGSHPSRVVRHVLGLARQEGLI